MNPSGEKDLKHFGLLLSQMLLIMVGSMTTKQQALHYHGKKCLLDIYTINLNKFTQQQRFAY